MHQGASLVISRFNYDEDISFGAPILFPGQHMITRVKIANRASSAGNRQEMYNVCEGCSLIRSHDLFIFQWAGTEIIRKTISICDILRQLGKKIVYVFNGDDVRHTSAYSQQCKDLLVEEFTKGDDVERSKMG